MPEVKFDTREKDQVPPIGPKDADIVIVGEALGADEVRKKKPFVGSSGRLLNQMLDKVGIKRHKCYITNVVKRRPRGNNFKREYYDKSKPKPELYEAWERVRQEIKDVNPNVIICLGAEATKAVLDDRSIKIGNWRGSVLNTELGKVIPTYHPAYILRMYKKNPIMLFDLKKAKKESLTPEYSKKEREILIEPSKSEALAFLEECKESEYVSFDIETLQLPNEEWFIDCIGLAISDDYGMAIPLTNGNGESYWSLHDEIEILRAISDVLGDSKIKKIAQNAQYDIIFLERLGVPVNNLWFDTMNASKIMYPEFSKSLAFLVSIYTDEPYYKDTSTSERWLYNGKDATCTYEVAFGLIQDLKDTGLYEFYRNHINPLLKIYIWIQQHGIKLDLDRREEIEKKIKRKIKDKRERLKELTGREINVYSPKDMRAYIYGELQMKERYNKNNNLCTSADTLTEFYRKTGKECFKIMLELRKDRSRKSTYIDATYGEDGRMRCTYDVSGTETGRLASKKTPLGHGMNLQNVTKDYRELFVADEGFVFLGADLSQAENRVVAYLCEDEKMMSVVDGTGDIHTNNAALIFDKPKEEITYDERQLGKRITHGSNYMMGPITFARYAEVSTSEAKKLQRKYHETYPKLKYWHKKIERIVRQTRTLENPFGRKRRFNNRMGSDLFREAVAYIPQSTVADAIHRATIEIYARLPHPARVILNLHDALTLQVPDDPEWIELGSEILEDALTRPFKIDGKTISIPTEVEVGYTWKEVS